MSFQYLDRIIFHQDSTLKDVLERFNETAIWTEKSGFAIITDNEGKCIGVVSDGDIRRKLLEDISSIFEASAPIKLGLIRSTALIESITPPDGKDLDSYAPTLAPEGEAERPNPPSVNTSISMVGLPLLLKHNLDLIFLIGTVKE